MLQFILFVFFIGVGVSGTTQADNLIFSFGIAANDGSETQRCLLWSEQDAQAAGVPETILDTGAVGGQLVAGSLTWTGEVTSFDENGFTLTTRDGGSGGDVLYFLAMKIAGGNKWVGSVDAPTSTGDDVQTGPGFTPTVVIEALSMATAENSILATAAAGAFGISVFTATEEFSTSFAIEDAATTRDTQNVSDNQAIN